MDDTPPPPPAPLPVDASLAGGVDADLFAALTSETLERNLGLCPVLLRYVGALGRATPATRAAVAEARANLAGTEVGRVASTARFDALFVATYRRVVPAALRAVDAPDLAHDVEDIFAELPDGDAPTTFGALASKLASCVAEFSADIAPRPVFDGMIVLARRLAAGACPLIVAADLLGAVATGALRLAASAGEARGEAAANLAIEALSGAWAVGDDGSPSLGGDA